MRRREVEGGSRFITFSCQRRLPLLRNPGICRAYLDVLEDGRAKHECELFAWVMMPEHVHLLMRPGRGRPLAPALVAVKMSLADQVIARWRALRAPVLDRITDEDGKPRYWQKGGGFDRNTRDGYEFCRTVWYIHRNPVERGLADSPRDYRWSSVRSWAGARDGKFRCDPPPGDPRM